MLQLKQPLESMFVSQEWSGCAWASKAEGKDVKKIVMKDKTFWSSVVYSIKTTKPLVHVLRIVDGEKTPAMGFIYGAMDEAKEAIAKNCDGNLSVYKEIWDIIDEKWENQLHRDLHAAAYFLNPRYRWSPNVSEHAEIKTGLYKCMERLIKEPNLFMKVDDQLDSFKYKRGLFGFRASMQSYMTRPPVVWWDNFGDEVPELKSFAMKILGLTCSSSACERNWSTFNQVHTKRRNRLSTSRLNSLVYIMYNRNLKYKHLKKQSRGEDVDPLIVEDIPSDDDWLVNPNEEDDGDDEHVEAESSRATSKRKRNESSAKGKGKSVEKGLFDEEDEFEEESGSDHHGEEPNYDDFNY